jgi:histidinol phosphatase-like PHP family hydrolase
MIDLHTHTFLSDGILCPSELVYSAKIRGYSAIAITDHVDFSNMDSIIPDILKTAAILSDNYGILVLTGAELTYVPPKLIKTAAKRCRELGAEILVVHGETVAENVPPETNFYAVNADIDILAHPGKLTEEVAEIAAKNDIKIEITARKYHNVTNKKVAKIALKKNAKLVLNTDSHCAEDLLTQKKIKEILKQSFLPKDYYKVMQQNSCEIIKKRKEM